MNTPKLRWLKKFKRQEGVHYPEYGFLLDDSATPNWVSVLQQQVADDRGVLTWVDVPIVYEERKTE